MTEPFPLLQAGGFTVHVDAFAWEPDADPVTNPMRLRFLSLLGSKQAVQAIWARLVKGEPATLSRAAFRITRICHLATECPRGWRFLTVSLPSSAGYHGVLVPEMALFTVERPDFLLLLRPAENAPVLHYRFLNRRVDLPLHSSWAEWLWERGRRVGETVALESFGLDAYRRSPNADEPKVDISAAVRRGSLRVAPGDVATVTGT